MSPTIAKSTSAKSHRRESEARTTNAEQFVRGPMRFQLFLMLTLCDPKMIYRLRSRSVFHPSRLDTLQGEAERSAYWACFFNRIGSFALSRALDWRNVFGWKDQSDGVDSRTNGCCRNVTI